MKPDPKTYPPVLIAVPVSEMKEYCLWEWIAQIKNLSYPNYDVLLVDNSDDPEFQYKIRQEGIEVVRVAPNRRHFKQILAESWNVIRKVALARKYPFHLCWETDIFGPYNVIERLLANAYTYKISAVGYSYFLGHGENSCLMAFDFHKTPKNYDWKSCVPFSGFMQMDGTLKETFNVGQGCILLNTQIYRHLKFRTVQESPDTYLSYDLRQLGLKVYMDTSVLMRHKNADYERLTKAATRNIR